MSWSAASFPRRSSSANRGSASAPKSAARRPASTATSARTGAGSSELAAGRRVLDLFAHTRRLLALRPARRRARGDGGRVGAAPARGAAPPGGRQRARRRAARAGRGRRLRRPARAQGALRSGGLRSAAARAPARRRRRAPRAPTRTSIGWRCARLAPGGLLFTFSCSGAVDAKLFRQILFAAAAEARCALALLAAARRGARPSGFGLAPGGRVPQGMAGARVRGSSGALSLTGPAASVSFRLPPRGR